MNVSVASQSKRKTRRKLPWKIFERIKKLKWGTPRKPMWIKHSWNISRISNIGAELNFSISCSKCKWHENQNNSPQSYWRWIHLGKDITYEFLQSQSVNVLSSFKCCDVLLKKMFNGEIIFHLKKILKLKRLYYYKWKAR